MKDDNTHDKFWQGLLLLFLLTLFFSFSVQAAVPGNVDYQGYLTDTGGSPVNGSVNITFSVYNVDTGGVSLWSDTQSVNVTNGLFSVKLGSAANPFPIGLFDTPLYIGINVAGDGEMSPRVAMASSGFAHKADDADTVGGKSAASLDQSSHVSDTGNPHSVSAAQIGAVVQSQLDAESAARIGADNQLQLNIDQESISRQAADANLLNVLNSHSSDPSSHHTRYSDAEAVAAILAQDGTGSGLDADTLDGYSAEDLVKLTELPPGGEMIPVHEVVNPFSIPPDKDGIGLVFDGKSLDINIQAIQQGGGGTRNGIVSFGNIVFYHTYLETAGSPFVAWFNEIQQGTAGVEDLEIRFYEDFSPVGKNDFSFEFRGAFPVEITHEDMFIDPVSGEMMVKTKIVITYSLLWQISYNDLLTLTFPPTAWTLTAPTFSFAVDSLEGSGIAGIDVIEQPDTTRAILIKNPGNPLFTENPLARGVQMQNFIQRIFPLVSDMVNTTLVDFLLEIRTTPVVGTEYGFDYHSCFPNRIRGLRYINYGDPIVRVPVISELEFACDQWTTP